MASEIWFRLVLFKIEKHASNRDAQVLRVSHHDAAADNSKW
jgi:hypothetical protein